MTAFFGPHKGGMLWLPLLLGLSACAGDLDDAQQASSKAAAFVGDMQQTTLAAISGQEAHHKAERLRIALLQVAGQTFMAITNQHRAIWSGAGMKDPQELYKSMAELTGDADLTKTAPIVLMTPVPGLNAPEIDREKFTALVAKFTKLSEGLSPIERAKALAPFIQVAVASFQKSVEDSKNEPSLVKPGKRDAPTGTIGVLAATLKANANPAEPNVNGQIETLETNDVPVTGLLRTLYAE
jgi:hypothetical protein